jgi:NAD(P)-dependent dehydrogenase (short-subunit alcohol dehydrogenase family)
MRRLDNKIAVITGGSTGIGKPTCELFVREGTKFIITDILHQEGKSLVQELKKDNIIIEYFDMNVSNENNVKNVFEQIYRYINK